MLLGNNVRVFALTKYRYMDGLGGRYTEVIDSQLSVLFDKSASTVFESAKGRMRVVKGVIDLVRELLVSLSPFCTMSIPSPSLHTVPVTHAW